MEMTDLLNLEVENDHLLTPGGPLFFFRVQPPNLPILDNTALEALYQGFEALMRGSEQIPFAIYAADLPVSLEQNREYIRSLGEPCEGMQAALLAELSTAQGRGNTERAYYIIVGERPRGRGPRGEWRDTLHSLLLQNGISALPVTGDAIISLLRGWLLREFVDDQIYMGVEE